MALRPSLLVRRCFFGPQLGFTWIHRPMCIENCTKCKPSSIRHGVDQMISYWCKMWWKPCCIHLTQHDFTEFVPDQTDQRLSWFQPASHDLQNTTKEQKRTPIRSSLAIQKYVGFSSMLMKNHFVGLVIVRCDAPIPTKSNTRLSILGQLHSGDGKTGDPLRNFDGLATKMLPRSAGPLGNWGNTNVYHLS